MAASRFAAFAAVLVLATPGAALAGKAVALDAVAGDSQSVRYEKGVGQIVSEGETAAVWAAPASRAFEKRITLALGVENKSDAPQDIDVSRITAVTDAGEPVAVIPLAELEKEAKRKAGWASFGVVLAQGLATASTYDTVGFKSNRRGVVKPVKLIDPVAAQDNAAAARSALGSIQDDLNGKLADLADNALQRTTVDPGEAAGGGITLAPPPKGASALILNVDFAGEIHELRFNLTR